MTLSPAFVEAASARRPLRDAERARGTRHHVARARGATRGRARADAAPPGWELALDGGVATWTGGRIEGTDVVSFPLEVTARTEPGNRDFRAAQRYDDGESVRWEASLTVVPATGADAPQQQLGRAVAAGAVGLAVIGVSLVARVAPAAATTSGEIAEPGATVAPVLFAQLLNDDLGCASYLVGCEAAGEAVVVDPHLAIEPILNEAGRLDARIVRRSRRTRTPTTSRATAASRSSTASR